MKSISLLLMVVIVLLKPPLFAQTHEPDKTFEKQQSALKNAFSSNLLAGAAQITANQEKYDVNYYSLDLSPDPKTQLLSGKTEILFNVTAEDLEQLDLNFWDGMTIHSVYFTEIPDSQLVYSQSDDILSIELGSSLVQNEQASISIIYSGFPHNSEYGSFTFDKHLGNDFIGTFNQPYGARAWWPCKDFPVDKADSIDIRVTVPSDLIVASNGVLRSETINQDNTTTYWWHHGYPIATYLVSLAIYPYFVWSESYVSDNGVEMPISFFTFADTNNAQPSYLVSNYKKTRLMIDFFADIFGEYPFLDEKYGHAEWLLSFGMEHQTLTSMGNPTERRVAHELSHMWWGDMITCSSYNHIWLNEGFARYAESLWFEHSGFSSSASEYQKVYHTYKGPGTIFVEDPHNDDIFDIELSYNKASWVLHMLRHVVGDSTFYNILKTYHFSPGHQHSTASTEDFQVICEQVSGLQLDKFFQQWIYGEFYPKYSSAWIYKPLDNGYDVKVEIKQLQTNTGLFWMPVDVNIITEKESVVRVAWDSLRTQSFEFFVDDKPLNITLDADGWILKETAKHLMTPNIKQVMLNNPYQEPGSGIMGIQCETNNPDSQNISLSVQIESFDKIQKDSISLYDDGNHGDGSASDGVFGGFWPVPEGELYYQLHMLTVDVDSGYINHQQNLSQFTSVGPVFMMDYITASGDSITHPGEDFLVKLKLKNNSDLMTIPNISADLAGTDSCVENIIHDQAIYGTLGPGETAFTEGAYAIKINPKCQTPHKTKVEIHIKSNDFVFWKDSLSFDIVSAIEKEGDQLPKEFLLKQNFPNPFNPITIIEYQLPQQSHVYLSIYNLHGQKVVTLVSKKQASGTYTVEWDATGFASGVYFYKLETDHSFNQSKKLILLK